jgi:hypothetical protein
MPGHDLEIVRVGRDAEARRSEEGRLERRTVRYEHVCTRRERQVMEGC